MSTQMNKSIRNFMERIRNGDINATIELMDTQYPNIDELYGYLGDKNETISCYASLALIKANPPDLAKRLTTELKNPNPYARAKALDTLAKLKDPSALDCIEAMLHDENERVRTVAEIVLKKFTKE